MHAHSLITKHRQGRRHRATTAPLFGLPCQRNADIFNSKYICTLDSLIHFNIVVVSAVLALQTILTDTKEEGAVFWNILRRNLNSRHIPRCKVEVLSYFFLDISAKRIDPKDVGDKSVLTESTSKTNLHAREHFQY